LRRRYKKYNSENLYEDTAYTEKIDIGGNVRQKKEIWHTD
jgi:hypothetical protein